MKKIITAATIASAVLMTGCASTKTGWSHPEVMNNNSQTSILTEPTSGEGFTGMSLTYGLESTYYIALHLDSSYMGCINDEEESIIFKQDELPQIVLQGTCNTYTNSSNQSVLFFGESAEQLFTYFTNGKEVKAGVILEDTGNKYVSTFSTEGFIDNVDKAYSLSVKTNKI